LQYDHVKNDLYGDAPPSKKKPEVKSMAQRQSRENPSLREEQFIAEKASGFK
jgi:hypothetical protein